MTAEKERLVMVGILIGVFVAAVINVLPFSATYKYHEAIKACEKDLPRNQRCKVTGVLDEKQRITELVQQVTNTVAMPSSELR